MENQKIQKTDTSSKTGISKFATFCNNNSNAITAIATTILVFTSCAALIQTYLVIRQQKKEEFHTLRAYVHAEDMKTIKGRLNEDIILVVLKNSGQTPAFDLRATIKIDDRELKSNNLVIDIYPQSILDLNFPFKGNLLTFGDHQINFEYHYRTYDNRCFSRQMNGTSSPTETTIIFGFGSTKNHEINCPD